MHWVRFCSIQMNQMDHINQSMLSMAINDAKIIVFAFVYLGKNTHLKLHRIQWKELILPLRFYD